MLRTIVQSIRTELRFMGTHIMSYKSPSAVRRFGPRGVRLTLLTSGVVFMAVICAWAVVAIIATWQAGHPLRGALLAMAALLLLLLTLRVMTMNWRAARDSAELTIAPADGSDQTGIWGVGGPSMREPGSTGGWAVRNVDRRYENRDD